MESQVTQRIKQFCKEIDITVSNFEKQCDMGNGYVGKIVDGIGAEKLSNISRNFPNLNFKWLLIGEGQMFIDDRQQKLDYNQFENILNNFTKDKDKIIAMLEKDNKRLEAENERLRQSFGMDTRKKETA